MMYLACLFFGAACGARLQAGLQSRAIAERREALERWIAYEEKKAGKSFTDDRSKP